MTKTISEKNTHEDGITIGSLATEKAGFHGAASTQGAAITVLANDASGTAIATAVNATILALRAKGVIAS